jgi:hypothetical protein
MAEFNYGTKRTEAQAIAETDDYVEPHDCFISYINNRWGWQSFSTTGDTPCAHYVSHQLGLKAARGATCKLGYLVRVDDVVGRLGAAIDPAAVAVGDVWARRKGEARERGGKEPTSHCGMVLKVDHDDSGGVTITIKHCSSGQQKVATDDWATKFASGGKFYRLPAKEANAEMHANLHRFAKGFAYRKPFTPMGPV